MPLRTRLESKFEGRSGVLDFAGSSIVDKPVQLPGVHGPYPRSRKALLWLVKDSLEHVRFAGAGGDEGNACCMIDDGVGEGDAPGRGLGAVIDVRDPAVVLGEKGVAGEERRCVTVRADAEKDEIEDGEARRVLLCEFSDELLLVGVGELLEVVPEGRVDGMDVVGGDGHFGEELVQAEFVI